MGMFRARSAASIPIVRFVAILFAAALLAGASCRPVYSDRPMGAAPVALPNARLAIDGLWCSRRDKSQCWSVGIADADNGVVALAPVRGPHTDGAVHVHVRHAVTPKGRPEGLGFLILSEQDAVLKGSYLWALAAPVDPSLLLVWFPFAHNEVFARMVERGELPGRIVAAAAGRSALLGEKTEQTVILENLTDEHLQRIIDRRGQLFDLSMTFVYERVWPR
jgi:hypothetical protein